MQRGGAPPAQQPAPPATSWWRRRRRVRACRARCSSPPPPTSAGCACWCCQVGHGRPCEPAEFELRRWGRGAEAPAAGSGTCAAVQCLSCFTDRDASRKDPSLPRLPWPAPPTPSPPAVAATRLHPCPQPRLRRRRAAPPTCPPPAWRLCTCWPMASGWAPWCGPPLWRVRLAGFPLCPCAVACPTGLASCRSRGWARLPFLSAHPTCHIAVSCLPQPPSLCSSHLCVCFRGPCFSEPGHQHPPTPHPPQASR